MRRAAGLTYAEQGSGAAVICLHGIGGNADSFAPQLDGLSGAFRVIAVNLPGYGGSEIARSATGETSFTFPALAERILAFMDALSLSRAHLLGQSIGGMIAIEVALRAPARVAGLGLVATTAAFGGRDDSFREAFLAARLKPLDAGLSMGELARRFVPEITGPAASEAAVEAAIASMAEVPESTYRAIIRCLVTFNRRDDIETLTPPACLIAGEVDENAPARTMRRMAERMAQARFHQIPGAGHLVNLEAPASVNAILHDFFRSIP